LGKEYRSFSPSLCNFLHYPVTSSLLGPNTLLSTLSLRSSLNVSDYKCYQYTVLHKYFTYVQTFCPVPCFRLSLYTRSADLISVTKSSDVLWSDTNYLSFIKTHVIRLWGKRRKTYASPSR
jgi:hypothetical protein